MKIRMKSATGLAATAPADTAAATPGAAPDAPGLTAAATRDVIRGPTVAAGAGREVRSDRTTTPDAALRAGPRRRVAAAEAGADPAAARVSPLTAALSDGAAESEGDAPATDAPHRPAAPTPNTTASPPTRPTYAAARTGKLPHPGSLTIFLSDDRSFCLENSSVSPLR